MSGYYESREIRSHAEREKDHNDRLSAMIRRGYEQSRRVRETMDERGLNPSDISTLSDLERLPVVSREQLIAWEGEEPPFGGLSPVDTKADRIFTSPGPVYEPHLGEADRLWARGYHAAGFSDRDIVINTFSYHMVAAGLTFHEGLRALGATVVPAGTASTEQQVHLIKDLSVTGYTGTPSFLKAIIDKAEATGYDVKGDLQLKRASFVAEPLAPSLRRVFEEDYCIDTYQMYGATEVGDIAYECSEKRGWHLGEEVIVEIVDPETGRNVEPGILGEVVVTRVNDLFFLFRFGTGDLSRLITDECPCGRTAYRLDGIAGRIGDAVKVRGMFIAPSQLKKVREYFIDHPFQVIVTRESHRDHVTVRIESDKDSSDLINRFMGVFRDVCTVAVDTCESVAPGSIPDDAPPLVDERDWN